MSEMQKAGPHHETGPHENTASTADSTRQSGASLDPVAGYAMLLHTGHGRYRRRLFLTLAAAERAVDRARDRGQYAELILVRVVPVGVVA